MSDNSYYDSSYDWMIAEERQEHEYKAVILGLTVGRDCTQAELDNLDVDECLGRLYTVDDVEAKIESELARMRVKDVRIVIPEGREEYSRVKDIVVNVWNSFVKDITHSRSKTEFICLLFLGAETREILIGDLEERYYTFALPKFEGDETKANRWYRNQIIRSCISIIWGSLRDYFTFRNTLG